MNTSSPLCNATPDEPWLGLVPFTVDDRDYFFGRDEQIIDLSERVHRSALTVLFGKSGKGKSSLIGAGLIPELQGIGHLHVIPELKGQGHRVELLRPGAVELGKASFVTEVIKRMGRENAPPASAVESGGPADSPTLWEFFHDRTRPWCQTNDDGDPLELPPVLIFDQFEEIFTKGEDLGLMDAANDKRSAEEKAFDIPARENATQFLDQLADLVENRVPASLRLRLDTGTIAERSELMNRFDFKIRPVRILLALREDFLHRLERQRLKMPSLMEQRVELLDLRGEDAKLAVELPGRIIEHQGTAPLVSGPVAHAIVCAAVGVNASTDLKDIAAVPPILSLLCHRLNKERIENKQGSIQLENATPEKAKDIIDDLYREAFGKLGAHGPAASAVIEDELANASGFRETRSEEHLKKQLEQAHVPNPANVLEHLITHRILVRQDARGGSYRLEFTHDQLAATAAKLKAEREQRRLKAEKQLAEEEQRRRMRWWMIGAVSAAVFIVGLSVMVWMTKDALNGAEDAKISAQKANRIAEAATRDAFYQKGIAEANEKKAKNANEELAENNKFLDKLFSELIKIGEIKQGKSPISATPTAPDSTGKKGEQTVSVTPNVTSLPSPTQTADEVIFDVFSRMLNNQKVSAEYRKKIAESFIDDGWRFKLGGKYEEAEKRYHLALTARIQLAAEPSAALKTKHDAADIYRYLADLKKAQGKYEEAVTLIMQGIGAFQRLVDDPANNKDRNDLQYQVASGYWSLGDITGFQAIAAPDGPGKIAALKASIAAFTKAQQIAAEVAEKQPDWVVVQYAKAAWLTATVIQMVPLALADGSVRETQLTLAESKLAEAARLFETDVLPKQKTAYNLCEYAVIFDWKQYVAQSHETKNWADARDASLKYRDVMKEVVQMSPSPNYKTLYATACYRLAQAYCALGGAANLELARVAAIDRANTMNEVINQDATNLVWLLGLPDAYVQCANIQFDEGNFEGAASQFQNAFNIWSLYPKLIDELKQNPTHKIGLEAQFKRLSEARSKIKPDDNSEAKHWQLLLDWLQTGQTLVKLPDFMWDEALESFENHLAEAEKLVALSPTNQNYEYQVANSYWWLAEVHRVLGEIKDPKSTIEEQQKQSNQHFRDAIQMNKEANHRYTELLKKDPQNQLYLRDCYNIVWQQAGNAQSMGDAEQSGAAKIAAYEQARTHYAQALAQAEQMKAANQLLPGNLGDPDLIKTHADALQKKLDAAKASAPSPETSANPEGKK